VLEDPFKQNGNVKSDSNKYQFPINKDNKSMNLNQKISLNFKKSRRIDDDVVVKDNKDTKVNVGKTLREDKKLQFDESFNKSRLSIEEDLKNKNGEYESESIRSFGIRY